jgi:hypothetical protein
MSEGYTGCIVAEYCKIFDVDRNPRSINSEGAGAGRCATTIDRDRVADCNGTTVSLESRQETIPPVVVALIAACISTQGLAKVQLVPLPVADTYDLKLVCAWAISTGKAAVSASAAAIMVRIIGKAPLRADCTCGQV